MKLSKDAISENKHENKNVHDAKSSSRSLQNLVNVYECLGMEFLEDVSHLLYECTCKKTLNLRSLLLTLQTPDMHILN